MSAETSPQTLEKLRFLTPAHIKSIVRQYSSPVYVYDETTLLDRARQALAFQAPYGLTVRYAMKANPLAAILRLFSQEGLHIDASSGYEVHRALQAGIPASHIMLTSQQLPADLKELVEQGMVFNATSLHQLEVYGQTFPGRAVSLRLNPGLGSGHTRSVSVAGPTSSFGIWHEHVGQIKAILNTYQLSVQTIHSHIGCGTDPEIWHQAAGLTLRIVEQFPAVTSLNLGGGFKVARMSYETATDMQELSSQIATMLTDFADKTGRQLKLEIEPGTFLTANAGTLLATIIDTTDTGPDGFSFIKLDAGMNDIMRPALHAAQQPLVVVNARGHNPYEYVVVGHNCESTDLLTPAPADSERPHARLLQEARIGDIMAIEGVGAYCSALRVVGYNSYPTPNEIMLTTSGNTTLINRSQGVQDFISSEI